MRIIIDNWVVGVPEKMGRVNFIHPGPKIIIPLRSQKCGSSTTGGALGFIQWVAVRLRPSAQEQLEEAMLMNTEHGFISCPVCGRKTTTKVLLSTELKDFPLYCKWCKTQTIIDYGQRKINISQRQSQS